MCIRDSPYSVNMLAAMAAAEATADQDYIRATVAEAVSYTHLDVYKRQP